MFYLGMAVCKQKVHLSTGSYLSPSLKYCPLSFHLLLFALNITLLLHIAPISRQTACNTCIRAISLVAADCFAIRSRLLHQVQNTDFPYQKRWNMQSRVTGWHAMCGIIALWKMCTRNSGAKSVSLDCNAVIIYGEVGLSLVYSPPYMSL